MKSAAPVPIARSAELAGLLHLLDAAYCRKSWHGPNLRGSLRNVTPAEAGWRAGRHSIGELAVHCAYWKYVVRRRLRGDKRGSFPLKGSNWFVLPEPLREDPWRGFVQLLDAQHCALCDAVAAFQPADLDRLLGKGDLTPVCLIHGAALHDVYHAGQIQIIKGAHRGATA
ncbi:MAG: DinB family protein [Planctomycetota bacterium]